MRNWQTEYWPLAKAPVSSSDKAGYWQCPRGPCTLRAAATVFEHPFLPDTRSLDGEERMSGDSREAAAGNARHQSDGFRLVCEVVEMPAEEGRSVCARRP